MNSARDGGTSAAVTMKMERKYALSEVVVVINSKIVRYFTTRKKSKNGFLAPMVIRTSNHSFGDRSRHRHGPYRSAEVGKRKWRWTL